MYLAYLSFILYILIVVIATEKYFLQTGKSYMQKVPVLFQEYL